MHRTVQGLFPLCLAVMLPISAQAAQGPGVGGGTATAWTQFAMAIAVYGGAGLMVAAGLIGAVLQSRRTRRHG